MRQPVTRRLISTTFALAVSATLAAMVIHTSMTSGRLAIYPRVDDVLYLARGAKLFDAARTSGMVSLLHDYVQSPPHSPMAASFAAIAFAIFGVHDWAPYILAAIPVACFLMFATRMVAPHRSLLAITLCLIAACFPALSASLQNLKPDYAAGIFTSIGMTLILAARPFNWGAGHAVICGLWFAFALLAKPTIFPQTLVLLCLCLGLRVFIPVRGLNCSPRDHRSARSLRTRIRWSLVCSAAVVLLALPHYIIAAPKLISYIRSVQFGDSSCFWRFQGSALEHARYYIDGPGGRLMLGNFIWVILAAVVVGTAAAVVRRSPARHAIAIRLLIALAAAFAIPLVNPVKIAQFGAVFQSLLTLAALNALLFAFRTTRGRSIAFKWSTPLACAALAAGTFHFTFVRPIPPRLREQDTALRSVWSVLESSMSPVHPTRITICAGPGDLCPELIEYWSVQTRLPCIPRQLSQPLSPPVLESELARTDIAIALDGDTGLTILKRASPGLDTAMLSALQSDSRWIPAARVAMGDGSICIFRRAASSP